MSRQDLERSPSQWLKKTMSRVSELAKGNITSKKRACAFKWVIKSLVLAVSVIVSLIARNKELVAKLTAATAEIDQFRAEKDFSKNLSDFYQYPTGRPYDEEISSIRQRFLNDHSRIEKNLTSLKRAIAIFFAKNGSNTDKEIAQEAEIASLKGQLISAKNQIKSLENKMAAPKANSKNSHLSPSKDLNGGASPKPKEKGATKKKRGAQEGHKRRARTKFTPEEADRVIEYEPEDTTCPCCNGKMVRDPKNDSQFDQLEIPPISLSKIIHNGLAFACPECHTTKKGSIPQEVKKQGFIGPNLLALLVILKTSCSVPLRKIKNHLLRDVFGIDISIGLLNNYLKKVALIIRPGFEEIKDNISKAEVVNVDESLFKKAGKKLYSWVFVTPMLTFYKVGTRSAHMLEEVLGDHFNGTIICDYYSAYRKFAREHPKAKLAFCWAHFSRDAKNCSEYLVSSVSQFGTDLLKLIDEVFNVKRARAQIKDIASLAYNESTQKLRELETRIIKLCKLAPSIGKAKGIALRFMDKIGGSGYFTFVDNRLIELTNNLAERSIRFIVTDRKISFGVQSSLGIIYSQVMWTAWRTLERQGKSFQKYLVDCQVAAAKGEEIPSLVFPGQKVPAKYRLKAIAETELELEHEKRAKKEADKAKNEASLKSCPANNPSTQKLAA